MQTEMIVIRHGETAWNAEARWQGHLDSQLSQAGLQQADALAGRLARTAFDVLYSSDLGRAYRTAERIALATGQRVISDAGLRERALGVFEGLTLTEIRERHPVDFSAFLSRDPEHVIPQGESLLAKHQRVLACMEGIASRHAGQRVVVVTHGGVLDSMFRHALGLSLDHPRRWVLYNASLNTFLVEEGHWSLGTWGDVSHLARTGTLDDY